MDLFHSLGYETVNAYDETFGVNGLLGRETMDEVVLVSGNLDVSGVEIDT